MSRGGDPAVAASHASPLPVRLDLTYSGFATNRVTWLLFKNQGELAWGCASGRAEVTLAGDLLPSTDQQMMSRPLPEGPPPSFAPVSQPWHVPGQTGPLESAQAIHVVCSDPAAQPAPCPRLLRFWAGPGPRALVMLRGCPSRLDGHRVLTPACLDLSLRTSRGVSHALYTHTHTPAPAALSS